MTFAILILMGVAVAGLLFISIMQFGATHYTTRRVSRLALAEAGRAERKVMATVITVVLSSLAIVAMLMAIYLLEVRQPRQDDSLDHR